MEELRQQQPKVEYLKGIYSRMHRGIVAHQVQVDAGNVDQLAGMAFVFLSMDSRVRRLGARTGVIERQYQGI